jgi:hypothetical protein
MKAFKILILLLISVSKLQAQDAVLISQGNFIRGTIQGTNFVSVAILENDKSMKQYLAKDIESFLWNGQMYASKPIVINNTMEFKFFKEIEIGLVNLYSFGEKASIEKPIAPQRAKVKPTFGIGIGSGGLGGGLGGGVNIGGGGRRNDEPITNMPKLKTSYFLEKPGTGPMQEINLANTTAVKSILLQKMGDDENLAQRIKNTENFDMQSILGFIQTYNSLKR